MKRRGKGMKRRITRICSTDIIGAIMTLFGLAGMAEAITEHGSFWVSAIIFAVGFAMVLWGYKR